MLSVSLQNTLDLSFLSRGSSGDAGVIRWGHVFAAKWRKEYYAVPAMTFKINEKGGERHVFDLLSSLPVCCSTKRDIYRVKWKNWTKVGQVVIVGTAVKYWTYFKTLLLIWNICLHFWGSHLYFPNGFTKKGESSLVMLDPIGGDRCWGSFSIAISQLNVSFIHIYWFHINPRLCHSFQPNLQ